MKDEIALRIVRTLDAYNNNVIRDGVDPQDIDRIVARYRELRIVAGSFQIASDTAKSEWVASVLASAASENRHHG